MHQKDQDKKLKLGNQLQQTAKKKHPYEAKDEQYLMLQAAKKQFEHHQMQLGCDDREEAAEENAKTQEECMTQQE